MGSKRLLLLTADAGRGHRSAAEAIRVALENQYKDQCEVEVSNPLNDPESPELIQRLEESYDQMVTETPSFYRFTYNAIDAPLVSDMVRSITARMLNDVIVKNIQSFKPDLVASTYPFYAGAVAEAIGEEKQDIPLVIVITDLTDVASIWYSPVATMHFVPTEEIREQALKNNIPGTRIRVTGLPVHPDFDQEKRDKKTLRQHLGWQEDLPTALIVAGVRTRHMRLISQYLDRSQPPMQLVIVCGGDQELYDHFKSHSWQKPVKVYGWVDNMPEIMKASDFLIAKAGGLILSEALACGLPVIIPEALPGQEEGNVRYIVENQAGAWAPGPAEVLATTLGWLKKERLAAIQANAKRIGKPEAAAVIASGLWGLMV